MFHDIPDEVLEALYDEWYEHRYFDRVLLSVATVIALVVIPPAWGKLFFLPFFPSMIFWGWGDLSIVSF